VLGCWGTRVLYKFPLSVAIAGSLDSPGSHGPSQEHAYERHKLLVPAGITARDCLEYVYIVRKCKKAKTSPQPLFMSSSRWLGITRHLAGVRSTK
jgi:hypothetical protein